MMLTQTAHNQICWYAEGAFRDPSPALFDPAWWQTHRQVVGSAIGRGVTWFVKDESRHLVLRHYYRGGMVGKLVRDRFWFEGVESSRAMAEYRLLAQLSEQGLPVPRPFAARMVKQGPLADEVWHKVGQTVRRLHEAGVYHADLNSHNLLLDKEGKVWVIDFDKGAIRSPGSWQQANLERLQRSFSKESQLHTSFHFVPENWQELMKGYQG